MHVSQFVVVGIGGAAEIAHGNVGISQEALPTTNDAIRGGRDEMVFVKKTQHVLDSAKTEFGSRDLSLD